MICRMCILESPDLLSIFENDNSQVNRAAVITQHFGFEPVKDDPITNMICVSCWTQIDKFHTYYLHVEEAQRKLINLQLGRKIKEENQRSNTTVYEDEVDKKNFLFPFENQCFSTLQETIYEEISTIDPILEPSRNRYKSENSGDADENYEEHAKDHNSDDNDEKDDDIDAYMPEINFQNVDNQSVSSESSDEDENKPIEMLRREIRQSRLRQNHNLTKIGSIDDITESIESSAADKSPPKKRGRKRKTDKPIPLNPRTTEYQMKSKQYDEEIAKRTKLKCDLCEQEFTIFNSLQRHYRAEHKIKGYVVCCGSKFFKRGMFLDHIMKHLEPDRLKCDICKKTYCSRRALQDHILVYHAPGDVKTFQCDQCPRKYLKQYQLNIHKKKHIPKDASQYNCEECGKGFNTNNALQTHRRYIHENKYAHMCHICAKVLRSRTLYLKHKLVEHEGYVEPKQQCKECGAWLKNAFRLKLHTKKHRERESRFICTICGKNSPSSSALQSHVKFVHEAQRQHQCTFCNKAFKRAISLKEHLTTHTGDVLYTCPHCPKTFNSRANMHSHRKKKHPKEWEEARRIRGAPIAMFGKAGADLMTNNSALEDNSLENTVNSANEECENEIAYDSLKEMA